MPSAPPTAAGPASEGRDLLRLLTCGSVDDGKSTLIGRLLHDAGLVPEDTLAALRADARRRGGTGAEIDFAFLLDGLEAERDQGITIDVAHRYVSTPRRAFIIADAPGHEQYTRNMATAASTADLAVLLADARKGLLVQTRRHALICSLFGVGHVVLAVNKMDLVGYDRAVFERIAGEFALFAADLGFHSVRPVPVAARRGDNVVTRSGSMAWYGGPSLLEHLEAVPVRDDGPDRPFRFPVQWVSRPNPDFRGLAGTVASGRVRVGDPVVIAPSGRAARVARLVGFDGDLGSAQAGDAVVLTLADEADAARGDLLGAPEHPPTVSDRFAADVLWLDDRPALPGRSYLMRIGTRTVPATLITVEHRLDVDTRERLAAETLAANEIGLCHVATAGAVAFDLYRDARATGALILIDRDTDATAAAGMIVSDLRARNLHWQTLAVSKAERARIKHQRPCVLWFTGLPASGKSTIANLVEGRLNAGGHHTMLLDGDNVRHGLSRDLGFSDADRVENIRRVGEAARLFVEAGTIVLCALISPFAAERRLVRGMVGADEFIEIFVDTPLETCASRDPKGLYARALAGEIENFTGVDGAYERPDEAEITIATDTMSASDAANAIVAALARRGVLDR